jgi:hypothetical protein
MASLLLQAQEKKESKPAERALSSLPFKEFLRTAVILKRGKIRAWRHSTSGFGRIGRLAWLEARALMTWRAWTEQEMLLFFHDPEDAENIEVSSASGP